MSVSKPVIPLSYGNKKAIFQFMPFTQRKLLARRCPELIVVDDVVPYKLRTLKIAYTRDQIFIEIGTEITVSWNIGNCFVVRNYVTFKSQKPRYDRLPVPMWKRNIFGALLRKYIDRPGTKIDTVMINGFHCGISLKNLIKISNIHIEMKEGCEFFGLVEFLNSLNHWCRHQYGFLSMTEHHKSLMSHEIFLKMHKIKLNPWFRFDLKYLMSLQATEIWMADNKCRFLNPRLTNANYLTLAEFWINQNRPIGFIYRSAYIENFEELKNLSQEQNWVSKFMERQKCISKEIDENKEINIYIDREKLFNIRILKKGTATETQPPIPPKLPSCRVSPAMQFQAAAPYIHPKRGKTFLRLVKFLIIVILATAVFALAAMLFIWLVWHLFDYIHTGYIFRCPSFRCLKQVVKDLGRFFKCLVMDCEIPDYFEPLDLN